MGTGREGDPNLLNGLADNPANSIENSQTLRQFESLFPLL